MYSLGAWTSYVSCLVQVMAVRCGLAELCLGGHLSLPPLCQSSRRHQGHTAGHLLPRGASGQRAIKAQLHLQSRHEVKGSSRRILVHVYIGVCISEGGLLTTITRHMVHTWPPPSPELEKLAKTTIYLRLLFRKLRK